VTKHCRGADPDVVRDRLAPILELAEVIEQSQTRQAAAK